MHLQKGSTHPESLPLQEVEAKFEKFGAVKEARIVRNPVNGESRGFGFVAMKYEEDVDAVSCVTEHCLPRFRRDSSYSTYLCNHGDCSSLGDGDL